MRVRALCIACLCLFLSCVAASAQTGVIVTGRLLNSLSMEPVAGATVQLDELRRETVTTSDGSFSFDNVPPGMYHLSVRSDGFSSRRTELVVEAVAPAPLQVLVDPEIHFEQVVSVSA